MSAHQFYLRDLMRKAWAIARGAASQFGGSARDYIASAMAEAWAKIKRDMWAKGTAQALASLVGVNPNYSWHRAKKYGGGAAWIGR
jgi:hypothetical protein